jgi:hypothetical protein
MGNTFHFVPTGGAVHMFAVYAWQVAHSFAPVFHGTIFLR